MNAGARRRTPLLFSSKARAQMSASCLSLRARIAVRGRRWIDRKAAGEAVSDRAITSQPGAPQSAAQFDVRQRATQNCDRQNSEIYLESATACHLSAVGQWVCQDQPHRHNEYAWQLTLLRDRAPKNFRRQIGTRDQ